MDQRRAIFESLRATLVETLSQETFDKIKTVLEFGSGKTGFAHWYGEGRKAFAVDLHDFVPHWAPLDVEYLQSDGMTIPLPDKSIELVVSHSVVEHVADLRQSLGEINRILAVGGWAYITVAPLYFSANGAHIRDLPRWEHLRPESKYYLMEQPIDRLGAYLNKLTLPQILEMVGCLPWDIMRCLRRFDKGDLPDFTIGWPKIDLRTREFRMIVRKMGEIT